MDPKHKLRKLLRLDGLHSAWEHARRWTHPVDMRPMFHALDPAKVTRLRQRYLDPGHSEDVGDPNKFADVKYWLAVNIERAQDLWLDRQAPRRILDLGCGAGYFVYVCNQLGHHAIGMDIDENPLFRETIDLLGIERIVGRIEAFAPLPDLGGKYDLVTAHCICFQKVRASTEKGWRDWDAVAWGDFLRQVRTTLLNPGGELLLDFNPRPNGVHYPPDVKDFFLREAAQIFRSKVRLSETKTRVRR